MEREISVIENLDLVSSYTVTPSEGKARTGQTVTVTSVAAGAATPKLIVTCDDTSVEAPLPTPNSSGDTFTFVMPASDVTLSYELSYLIDCTTNVTNASVTAWMDLGELYEYDNNKKVHTQVPIAQPEDEVVIRVQSSGTAAMVKPVVMDAEGNELTVSVYDYVANDAVWEDSDALDYAAFTFVMPASDVTVHANLVTPHSHDNITFDQTWSGFGGTSSVGNYVVNENQPGGGTTNLTWAETGTWRVCLNGHFSDEQNDLPDYPVDIEIYDCTGFGRMDLLWDSNATDCGQKVSVHAGTFGKLSFGNGLDLHLSGGKVDQLELNTDWIDSCESMLYLKGSPVIEKLNLGRSTKDQLLIDSTFAGTSSTADGKIPVDSETSVPSEGKYVFATGTNLTQEIAERFVYGNYTGKVNEDGTELYFGSETYEIREGTIENGTMTFNKTTAVDGTAIEVTVIPETGYAVKEITVVCDDTIDAPVVTLNGNGGTFIMPASDVTVNVEMQQQITVSMDEDYADNPVIVIPVIDGTPDEEKSVTLENTNDYKAYIVPDDPDAEYDFLLEEKLDGYSVKIEGTFPNYTITATSAQYVTFEVSDTEHTADGESKSITIDSVTPNVLTADNFTVSYYLINENGDDETLFQPVIGTPTQVGKYVYVIEFADDHTGYEFENEFHAEAGSSYYAWEASEIPSDSVTYSNAGIMTIEAAGKDLGTMSFAENFVEVYASGSVTNALDTSGLIAGAAITYESSDGSIASVDENNGAVSISGVGTVTITATASLDGYTDKTAQYVLKVNPDQYVITLADKEVIYGDEITGNSIAKVEVNGEDKTGEYTGQGGIGTAITVDYSGYQPGSPVGTYKITGAMSNVNPDDTNVYTFVPATLTVKPKELTISDFTVTASDKVYDGSNTAVVSAYVTANSAVTALITGTFSDADAGETKAVTYTITGVTGDGAGNYTVSTDITGTTTATIDKATVAVTIADNTDVVYGNTPNVSVFAMANGKQFTDFTVSYAKDDAPVETGSLNVTNSPYDVVLTLGTDSAKNYEFAEYEATLTVLPATGDFLVAAPSGTIYYGDTGLKLTHTDGWTAQYSVSGTAVTVDDNGNISVNGVGQATITVTGSKANYNNVVRTVELEVKPRPVSVTAVATNKVYDGTVNVEVTLSLNDGVTRALTGLTLNTDNVTATVQDANVGTGKIVTVTDFTLSDSTNYTLISETVTTTVNITPKEITQITFDAVDKKYDGNANADVENIALTGVLAADKDSVSVIGSATFDNADVATNKTVTFKNLTLNGAKSGNYTLNLTTEPTSTANITARPVVFTFGQTEFPYDGNPKTVNITAATDDGKVFTDFTAAYGGNLTGDKAINAGNYTITITLNNNNYTFQNSADAAKTLTITAVDQNEMKIFGNPDDLYYGREFTLNTFGGNGNGAVTWSSNDTSVATVDQATGAVKIIGVGNVTITATRASDGNYNAQTAKIELTTTQREVTFTISDNVKIFDGSKQSVTVTPSVSGLVAGTDYTVTYEGDCTDVGTYKVTVTATGNYSGSAEGTLTINKGDLTISGFAVEDTTYGVSANVNTPTLPDGVIGKLIFIVDGKETEEQPRNVGSYIAYYTATGDNYNTLEVSDSFEIKQAVLTATASNASRQYGNGNPVFEITYSGFQYNEDESVINVKPTASSTASVTSPVGTYDITVSGGSDDNYTFDYVTGTLTITESDVEESKFVIYGPATATYGDTITLSAKYDGNSVNVAWSSSDEKVATIDESGAVIILKSGEVTFTATMNDSNYGDGTATKAVNISKQKIDIEVSNNVKPYNGKVQAPTFSSEDADLTDVTIETTYTNAINGQAAEPMEVGTYTVSYKVAETDERYIGSGTATFTITNGIPVDDDLDGNVDDDDYVYGSDEDGDGIYDGANGETYIPSGDVYVEVTGPDEDGIYDSEKDPDTDGFDDKYIPVDKDNDGDYDDSIVDKDGDGIFEDSEGNTYIPDQDGDGRPEPDTDGDGIFEGTDSENKYIPSGDNDGDGENDGYLTDSDGDGIYEDEDGNKYIPDQDGDGKPEPDADGDGIFDGTNDEDGDGKSDNTYVPDQDGDGKPEKVVDNGDGTYTEDKDEDGDADEDGTSYIPDQDGDGKPEADDDGDGVYDGTNSDNTYIPDQDGDGKPEVDDNGDGVYDGTKDEDGDSEPDNTYIPDQDGDGKAEVDDDGDGIYDGTKDEDGDSEPDNTYIPDQDGDGKAEVDNDGDGIYDGTKDEDGEPDSTYIPDQDGDGKPEPDSDGDGIFEGSDNDGDNDDGDEDHFYVPDGGDDDSDPDEVIDNGNGTYTDPGEDGEVGTDDDGPSYIPDQDGDGKAEPDTDGDGVYDGTDGDTDYVPVDKDGDGVADDYVDADEVDDGVYTDPTTGKEYEDNNGDSVLDPKVPVDTDGDGDADKYVDPDDVIDGVYTDPDTGKKYEDQDGDGILDPKPTYPGGGGIIIVPTYYNVYVNSSANGDVTANRTSAASGTTITLTVDPDDGYELNTLSVTDRYGNAITVTAKTNGTYTFRMPSKDVWVTATFTKEAETPDTPSVHICPSKEFSDVNTNLWYHEAIDFVLWHDYMNGMGNGQFQPGTALNRAMIVQVLYNMENRPDYKTVSSFEDVKSGDWFYDAINWAAENNIVNGYSDTEFGPNDPITREQMAAILYRYADYKDINVTARGDLSIFTDGNKTSAWALDEVRWAVKVGLISGKGNGVLDPTGTATRAEVAQILMNYCKKVLGE